MRKQVITFSVLMVLLCVLCRLASAQNTVHGTITLQDVVNSVQPITFEFCPSVGSASFTRTVTLAADGSYTLTNIPANNYYVKVKGAKWLGKVIVVNASGGDVMNANATLLAGDADDNNTVDFDDLTILAVAYNTALGDPLYDARADFNCDNQVEFADLTLLSINYNLNGEECPPPLLPFDIPAPPWAEGSIPTDAFSAGENGPSSADVVNLASGVYENHPGPDMVVRNPRGPNPVYARMYRSAQAGQGYHSLGLSPGWVDNYDIKVQGVSGSWGALTLIYPNGATETLTPIKDANGNPTGVLSPPPGAPYLATGQPLTTPGQWQWIKLTFKDQTSWTFTPAANNRYWLHQITNLLNQSIFINRDSANNLVNITDDAAKVLLSFGYSGAYLIMLTDVAATNTSDRRYVTFTFSLTAGTICLTSVSQITQVGLNSSTQWVYGYDAIATGQPLLDSVGIVNPTGAGGTLSRPINYDSYGRVRSLLDASNNQRIYTYNSGNTQVQVKDSGGNLAEAWTQNIGSLNLDTGITDANNHSAYMAYTNPNNPYQPTSITNKNNQTATLTYDQYGSLLTMTVPSNGNSLITTNTYDYASFALGRLMQTQVDSKTPLKFDYWSNGLVKTVYTPTPGTSGANTWVRADYTYTALGNVATVTLPAPNNAGGTVMYKYNYTDDPDYGISNVPEALGEPLTIEDPLGHRTHFRYDARGNVLAVIDALGNRTDYIYDVADQITRVTYPHIGQGSGQSHTDYVYLYPGGSPQQALQYDENNLQVRKVMLTAGNEDELSVQSGSTEKATFVYDPQYRLKQLQDGKSNPTQHTYDVVGNLTKTTFPLYNASNGFDSTQWAFDADHNPIQRTDGRYLTNPTSLIITYTRAADDSRLTQINYPANTIANVHYDYDLYGRVTLMTDGTGTTAYAYDDLDNLTTVTTTYNNQTGGTLPSKDIIYSYNTDGTRASMNTPAGTFSYTYDAAGRLTDVSCPWSGGSLHYDYDNADRLTHQGQSKADTTYMYNALGWLTDLTNRSPSAGTPLLSRFSSITYDALGNRTSMTITIAPLSVNYDASGFVSYTYDTASPGRDRLKTEGSTRPNDLFNSF